jgi:3',5'-cyclic AMP phosphodiesterase CpdA
MMRTAPLIALLIGCSQPDESAAPVVEEPWRFVAMADTHLIDDFYDGVEGSDLDTESIYLTRERLEGARARINGYDPLPEAVFVAGDFIHNYPSDEWDFYLEHETRWDVAAEIVDGFDMPVWPGLGNHDYDVPDIAHDFTHELFLAKLGIEPYYAVDINGWRFLHLNNFLGETWDPDSELYDKSVGSLGFEQLDWLEEQLAEELPSVVFLHYPLFLMAEQEPDGGAMRDGLTAVLADHADTVRMVFGGHIHLWMDFTDSYDPPYIGLASTRYDADSYAVWEVDPASDELRWLNQDCTQWGSRYAEPW